MVRHDFECLNLVVVLLAGVFEDLFEAGSYVSCEDVVSEFGAPYDVVLA